MNDAINAILAKPAFDQADIVTLLGLDNAMAEATLYPRANQVKLAHLGNKVYFRGLIELSNICSKNCLYCGIRAGNQNVHRYEMTEAEVLEAAQFAWDNRYASIVIQSGERQDQSFIDRIDRLLRQIQELTHNELRVTLSCGEQSESTYRRWFDSGARRYLLRIETSDEELYYQIHPKNDKHDFHARLKALNDLKKLGYQVGSGIMVGLPFQTLEQIANDLIFLRDFDVDMVGMGPYIEHEETPLYSFRETLVPRIDRFDLTLRAIAILRLMMPDINIASATALQAIDPAGREKAFGVGTNVIMPNLTPTHYRGDYTLYEDKPCINENPAMCLGCLEARIKMFGGEIGYGEWGDSRHYARKGEKP